MRLILASESRARREMLTAAGLCFEAIASGVDEADEMRDFDAACLGATPTQMALHLAGAKAAAVSALHRDSVVIGSDQVLALEGEIVSKSPDRETARGVLLRMRGRRHELHSAVVVVHGGRYLGGLVDTARLEVRDFTEAFLDGYLDMAGDALTTCVGTYRLEGPGIQLFERIEGDFHTILGMPLLPLLAILREHRIIVS